MLADLPQEVREAFLSGDQDKIAAAFTQLTPEQQQEVMAAMRPPQQGE